MSRILDYNDRIYNLLKGHIMNNDIQPGDWVKLKNSWELFLVGEKTSTGVIPKGNNDVIYLFEDIEKVQSNNNKTNSFKKLVKKVSYDELQKLCEEKNWSIPTSEEVKDFDHKYQTIWVADEPKRDISTRRLVLDAGKVKPTNRGFLYNAVVIRNGDALINSLNKYVEEYTSGEKS